MHEHWDDYTGGRGAAPACNQTCRRCNGLGGFIAITKGACPTPRGLLGRPQPLVVSGACSKKTKLAASGAVFTKLTLQPGAWLAIPVDTCILPTDRPRIRKCGEWRSGLVWRAPVGWWGGRPLSPGATPRAPQHLGPRALSDAANTRRRNGSCCSCRRRCRGRRRCCCCC